MKFFFIEPNLSTKNKKLLILPKIVNKTEKIIFELFDKIKNFLFEKKVTNKLTFLKLIVESKKNTDVDDKKKILVDGRLICDFLLDRIVAHKEDTENLLNLIKEDSIKAYITQQDLENIWLVCEKLKGSEGASNIVKKILNLFDVISIDKETIYHVSQYNINNFDMAILIACCNQAKLDGIVTVSFPDFVSQFDCDLEKKVNIFTVYELLFHLKTDNERTFLDKQKQQLNRIRENLEKSYNSSYFEQKLSIAGWYIEDFQVYSSKDNYAKAKVKLCNYQLNKFIIKEGFGCGPIEALCRALDLAIQSSISPLPYILDWSKLENIDKGLDSKVSATIILKCGEHCYKGENIQEDSVKAVFFAYVQALNKIFNQERIEPQEVAKTIENMLVYNMLNNLSNVLSHNFPNPQGVPLEKLGELVEKLEIPDEFLSQYISFKDETFLRELIFQKNNLTVYLIAWKPGQIAGKHHHGMSLDAIRVVQGKMTHWKFPKISKSNPDISALTAFEGFSTTYVSSELGEEFSSSDKLILIDRWEPHQIGNKSEDNLVTLHFRFGTPPDDDKWHKPEVI